MQVTTTAQTRQCPFCAETILAAAVKCRFCGEFLNTDRARSLLRQMNTGQTDGASIVPRPSSIEGRETTDDGREDNDGQGGILYSGQPTLWVMAGAFVKGGALLIVSLLLIFWHIERTAFLNLSPQHAVVFGKYRLILGLLLMLAVILFLFYKALQVRMTHYEVSTERIEFGIGIFDRRIDNLDMFRVIDIKLRRNFFDCIVGTGTVLLTTTDKSHPEFAFEKIADSRALYDAIKKASLSADRKTNVIHME